MTVDVLQDLFLFGLANMCHNKYFNSNSILVKTMNCKSFAHTKIDEPDKI